MKTTFTKFSYLRTLALIFLLIGGINYASSAECDTEQSASSTDNHDGTVSVTYTTGKNPFFNSDGTMPDGLGTYVTLTVYRYENNTTGEELLSNQYACSNYGATYTKKLDLSVLQPGEKYFVDVKFEYAISGGSSYCKTYINLIKTMGYPLAYITSCSQCYSEKIKITVYDPMHRAMDYAKVRVFKTLASGDEWLALLTPENTVDIDTNYYYFYHEDLSEGDIIDYNLNVLYDGSKYVKHIWDFDDAFSAADEDDFEQGVCYDLNFRSTSESNAVKLEWDEILCDDVASITLYRYNYNGTQELASKNIDVLDSKSYSDGENIVSGYNYKYKIIVKDSDGEVNNVDYTYGRSTPNGYIAGSITTTTGVPIKGDMKIIAKRQDEVESDTTSIYYGVYNTDDGSYKISNIFYNTGSSFTVYPVMEDHGFDPEKIRDIRLTDEVNSNYAEGKNFKDTTALAIYGNVSQRTPDGSSCPMEGVSILRDDIDYSIVTDKNGDFLITVPSAGKYKLTPDLDTHLFSPPFINIEIANDTSGIKFLDTTEFKLEGYFSASCSTYIGTAKLNIYALDECFSTSVETDNSGAYSISLPARAYEVSIASFETIDAGFVTEQDIKDYFTIPDTVDITSQDSILDFIYKFPPTLEILPVAEFSTCPSEMYIMEQADSTDIIFNINEVFNGQECIVDEGYIVVTQNITTSSDDFIADTVFISNGVDTLRILPGEPKVTDGDYLKKLTATAYVGNNVVSKSIDVLVVGSKPREQTFTTVTPDIPFLILHDPPGDGSYSYFEKGTSIENSFAISGALTGTVNAYAKLKLGAKYEAGQFVFVESKVYGEISSSTTVESYTANNDELSYVLTTTESFGTSSSDDFVGADADVYVGGAMNLIYALSDIIEFNADDCSINKSQNLIVAPNGFATTFMYTEDHIKKTVIPQLKEMSELSETDSLKFYYKTQADSWEQIVELNHDNMEQADFNENISINGGVTYESFTEKTKSRSMSWETNLAVETELGLEAGFEVGGSGSTLGGSIAVKIDVGFAYSGTSSTTTKTGFVLEDDRDKTDERQTVLVIHPQKEQAQKLMQQVREKKYKVIVAASIRDGIVLAEKYKPKAIMISVELAASNRQDYLKLKNHKLLGKLPVHVISPIEQDLDEEQSELKTLETIEFSDALKSLDKHFDSSLKKMLIIEDNLQTRELIKTLLFDFDLTIVEAELAEQAYQLMSNDSFDCIILDLGLPDYSGKALLEKLKSNNITIPKVIVYTGKEMSRQEVKELESYTNTIILKGIKSDERLMDEVTLFLHQVTKNTPEIKAKPALASDDSIFKGKKILVVDDDIRNVFALGQMLEEREMTVFEADNGQSALDILKNNQDFDLILMDVMMPVMDGYKAMQIIRQTEGIKDIPIICLTAKAMKEDHENALKNGANDYLAKPLSEEKLFPMLKIWLYNN